MQLASLVCLLALIACNVEEISRRMPGQTSRDQREPSANPQDRLLKARHASSERETRSALRLEPAPARHVRRRSLRPEPASHPSQ